MKTEKICPTCGEPFEVTEAMRGRRKYCSLECRNKAYVKKKEKKIYIYCEWCGDLMPPDSTEKYCSAECERKATSKSAKKSGRKNKMLSLVEICKLAKEEGLTYGQYVVKMQKEKEI